MADPILVQAARIGGKASLIGSGVEAAGGLLSSAGSYLSARQQMKFQERMSNTAHQREVADLIAAGINPIMTATGGNGASSPMGASVNVENPLRGYAQNYLQRVIARDEARLRSAEIDKTRQDKQTSISQENLNSATALRQNAETLKAETEMRFLESQIPRIASEVDVNSAMAANTRMRTLLESYDRPGKANIAKAHGSWFGRNIAPYIGITAQSLNPLLQGASSAAGTYLMLRGMKPRTTEIHGKRGGIPYSETRTQFDE